VIRDQLATALREALTRLGIEPPRTVHLERPARREHGDWSSNVALASAKAAGRNPRELAGELARALSDAAPPHVLAVEVAGPGFVNFRLADTWLHDVLVAAVQGGVDGFARPGLGTGVKVNVEFVSANPNGPLHAGHGRGTCYGDSLARLLEHCGYEVTREFYLNDRGVQMGNFAASLVARQRGEEGPENGYKGEYISDWAREMPAGADVQDALEWGYSRALADQREVLAALGVHFDVWTSERALVAAGAVEAALNDLRSRDIVFEEDGAIWLRSTVYGDDKDRVLVKSDGQFTYLLPDIAYHRDKFERGFDLLIDVWGADHHGYVPRMKAAMQALGKDPAALEVVITQLVKLIRAGEEVRLGKRSGNIIELRDVIDEVGADATRLTYLLQSSDTKQTFDLELARAQSMDNPVYYVQMAHARICSVTRVAAERGVQLLPLDQIDLTLLTHERELEVLRSLAELNEVLSTACVDRAPHRVTTWVRELAGAFHGFYHDCYVMGDGVAVELTQARLALSEASRVGLRIGLDVLGVSAPESM
jgi:arginyl-tRNA synthetase